MKRTSRFLISIDLGTTNCVVSFVDNNSEDKEPKILNIMQWDGDGVVELPYLPSFVYCLGKGEIKRNARKLPIHPENFSAKYIIGIDAKRRSLTEPGRVIHSAKSWLAHKGIAPKEPSLPWNSDHVIGDQRISPFEVTDLLLEHIRLSWTYQVGLEHEEEFTDQKITITVPASFSIISQQSTVEASLSAGYPESTEFLEEPQAAFYCWLSDHQDAFASVSADKNILVCDIGGGTSDFSLLKVHSSDKSILREKVSPHILLGGDNLDMAIASELESKLTDSGQSLSSKNWAELISWSRQTKENAFASENEDDEFHISLSLDSADIFANTLSVAITSAEIKTIVANFLPHCSRDSRPTRSEATLKEWGLPYEQDVAFTRHLAAFLDHTEVDYVLFAGGTSKASLLRATLVEVINSWQETPVEILHQAEYSNAICLVGAYYLYYKENSGTTIEAHYPRNLLIEVARPGGKPAGLCVVSKDQAYGSEINIQAELKGLINETSRFTLRTRDSAPIPVGTILELESTDLVLADLSTKLVSKNKGNKTLPLTIKSHLSQNNSLQLYCLEATESDSPLQWPLVFNLSQVEDSSKEEGLPAMATPTLNLKCELAIKSLFGKKVKHDQKPSKLVSELETHLELAKAEWGIELLRQIAQDLLVGIHRRGRSLEHESVWLNLAGYCLRPGFGHSKDIELMDKVWPMFQSGLTFPKETRAQIQWYILWRRVAGGLNKPQQETIFAKIYPSIKKKVNTSAELFLLAGSLEYIDIQKKIQLGDLLVQDILSGKKDCIDAKLFCLARLASRVPLHGSAVHTIRPSFVEPWVRSLLTLNHSQKSYRALPHLYSLVCRVVNHRELDIGVEIRTQVLDKLKTLPKCEGYSALISDYVPIDTKDFENLFGESLPIGISL